MEIFLLIVAIIIVGAFTITSYNTKRRREILLARYGDEALVARLMAKTIWQGMTEAQLIDSWGPPVAREEKVYKTKVTETWKYNQTGRNRFKDRVFLENSIVTGWKQR